MGFHIALLLLLCLAMCDGFFSVSVTKHNLVQKQKNNYQLNLNAQNDKNDSTESELEKNLDDKESTSYTWEELQADPELSQLERKSSMQRKNAMLLPQRISQATGILAWTFVIVGIILNTLGYAYIRDPSGGIGIGTLK